MKKSIAFRLSAEQKKELRERQLLIMHYRTVADVMQQELEKTIEQMAGVDLNQSDYELDLEAGVLRHANPQ